MFDHQCFHVVIPLAGTDPSHVITPDMSQQALFDAYMPQRIRVNIMAYGQTGAGKVNSACVLAHLSYSLSHSAPQTHTMFGPPGIMDRAGRGPVLTRGPGHSRVAATKTRGRLRASTARCAMSVEDERCEC